MQFINSLTSGQVLVALWNDNTVIATDGTITTKPKILAFTDLIGQPKWVDINMMQFTTVMRADIQVGSYVMMPPGLQNLPGIVTTTQPAAYQQLKYKTAFQGTFLIQSVRHIGNFRDPDGAAWATIFQASVPGGA
jgi:hypothetical protein